MSTFSFESNNSNNENIGCPDDFDADDLVGKDSLDDYTFETDFWMNNSNEDNFI